MVRNVGILLILSLLVGCSSMRSAGLGVVSPMFKEAMTGIESEGRWEHFKKATPANLTLVDGLLSVRPHDPSLLLAAIKGNAGYAFGVEETLYLEDKLNDEEESVHKDNAIAYYSKAVEYGLRFLNDNDLSLSDLQKAQKEAKGVRGLLASQLSNDETTLELMLFFAQSMGSLINMQRDNILLVAQLPIVKGMFDWVCDETPDIAHGTCSIFYGSYEAGRPATLGGNPTEGKRIFEELISKNPANWLARVSLMQYYSIPQYDEDSYYFHKKSMEKYVDILKESFYWSPGKEGDEHLKDPTLRLYQAIAIKRYEIIKKYEKDLF
ncbi:MAG: hypothetical protein CME63_14265 [Halobacteriovoraceae bacterium]|nr:hypothetical protein [Halobacteriovoraceae bacterium]|tara:strand:+ start:491938 stop:492906 length:969 start_codon:yes stop_codon:yes gene_type:complete